MGTNFGYVVYFLTYFRFVLLNRKCGMGDVHGMGRGRNAPHGAPPAQIRT